MGDLAGIRIDQVDALAGEDINGAIVNARRRRYEDDIAPVLQFLYHEGGGESIVDLG